LRKCPKHALVLLFALVAGGCRDLSVMEVVSDLGTGAGSGVITLGERAIMPSGWITDASAVFQREAPQPMYPCSTQTLAGGCTATTCTQILDLGTTPVVIPVNAGVISVTGGASALSFSPSPDDNTYSPSGSPMNLWAGGEMLTASSMGGVGAPPFAVALTAPAAVTITAPAGTVTLTSGQDLVLSTTATDPIRVGYEYVDPAATPTTTLDVACVLTASNGKLTFPAAALAEVPAGKHLTIAAATTATATTTVGMWTIALTATANAAFPGGNNGVSVTVQ